MRQLYSKWNAKYVFLTAHKLKSSGHPLGIRQREEKANVEKVKRTKTRMLPGGFFFGEAEPGELITTSASSVKFILSIRGPESLVTSESSRSNRFLDRVTIPSPKELLGIFRLGVLKLRGRSLTGSEIDGVRDENREGAGEGRAKRPGF